MTCRLFGTKPLPEPMLTYCQLDSWEQISVKFEAEFYHFQSRKCIWNGLPKWRPFCPGGNELPAMSPWVAVPDDSSHSFTLCQEFSQGLGMLTHCLCNGFLVLVFAARSKPTFLICPWNMFGFWKSCWQFAYAIPKPAPAPKATGHGRPVNNKGHPDNHVHDVP